MGRCNPSLGTYIRAVVVGPSPWTSSPGGSMRSRFMILLAIAFVGGVAGAQAPANSNTASTPGRTEIRLTYLGNLCLEITDPKTYVLLHSTTLFVRWKRR